MRTHLVGRLILLPCVERAVCKAEYSEPEMVCRALLILANEYRDSRMDIVNDEPFGAVRGKYAMDFGGSIDEVRADLEDDAYFFNYLPRATIVIHIERGNSREPRYCMRIFFFWDENPNQVVGVWLCGHLSNWIC